MDILLYKDPICSELLVKLGHWFFQTNIDIVAHKVCTPLIRKYRNKLEKPIRTLRNIMPILFVINKQHENIILNY